VYKQKQKAKGKRQKMRRTCSAWRFACGFVPFACAQNYSVHSIILLFAIILPSRLAAQDAQTIIEGDSIIAVNDFAAHTDSLVLDNVQMEKAIQTIVPKWEDFKPDPTKAVLYSAIFPGLGQIYNRKYWKLPIVYGGFLGCAYAITWNGNQYSGYKNAYNDFTDNSDATNSWKDYVPYSWRKLEGEWDAQRINNFSRVLKNQKDFHRRNRDLSYIVTVGLYLLCMLDAYVDAQLFDFNISPDLSLRLDPVIIPQTTPNNARTFGLQCSLAF
jgi:hypothetical protein